MTRTHRRPALTAALLLAVGLLAGCESAPAPQEPASLSGADPSGAASARDVPAAGHVVAISVDGLNPDAIRRLGRSGAPALHRLLARGAGTFNARTARELTRTLPNHAGMVTGRPVRGPDGHRITFNHDDGSTVGAHAGGYVASVFDVVHDHGGSTAFYSSKDKLDLLDRSWNGTHGAADRVGTDEGRDKIDRYVRGRERANVRRLVTRLRTAPDDLSFVHLAEPDTAGHASGFMSAAYLDAVRATDRKVGRIVAAVRRDPHLRGRVAIVLTADHGGRGAGHADPRKRADYTVPFVVWGPGVARGANLYALNDGLRKRPGARRTSYRAVQPVRNAELANVVTRLLGLPDVPGSVLGRTPLRLN